MFDADGAESSQSHTFGGKMSEDKVRRSVDEAAALKQRFAAIHTEYWNSDYLNPHVLDGEQ
jgi:hypothetical protein